MMRLLGWLPLLPLTFAGVLYETGPQDVPFSAILPDTLTQCETATFFYNSSGEFGSTYYLTILPLRNPSNAIGPIVMPRGSQGFLRWVCNIPAGYTIALGLSSGGDARLYTIQPGSSDDCLGPGLGVSSNDLSAYTSFTAFGPDPTASVSALSILQQKLFTYITSEVQYPNGLFELASDASGGVGVFTIGSTSFSVEVGTRTDTGTSQPSPATASNGFPIMTSPPSPTKTSHAGIIAGTISGAFFIVLATLVALLYLRKRKRARTDPEVNPPMQASIIQHPIFRNQPINSHITHTQGLIEQNPIQPVRVSSQSPFRPSDYLPRPPFPSQTIEREPGHVAQAPGDSNTVAIAVEVIRQLGLTPQTFQSSGGPSVNRLASEISAAQSRGVVSTGDEGKVEALLPISPSGSTTSSRLLPRLPQMTTGREPQPPPYSL